MASHPLYGHGECKWPGCEALCEDMGQFIKWVTAVRQIPLHEHVMCYIHVKPRNLRKTPLPGSRAFIITCCVPQNKSVAVSISLCQCAFILFSMSLQITCKLKASCSEVNVGMRGQAIRKPGDWQLCSGVMFEQTRDEWIPQGGGGYKVIAGESVRHSPVLWDCTRVWKKRANA